MLRFRNRVRVEYNYTTRGVHTHHSLRVRGTFWGLGLKMSHFYFFGTAGVFLVLLSVFCW